ncbi:DUF3253 domain-containing protein [Ornithinimicrobium pratense]|uniref:DUF3253 domain-containing protein n=1 Tax=Ornithinimicrobium pratense TaxID=2593973 RepID=A0A5J6V433_9MICO|nr:DUF3253 domain-containing protein [Ornithinimicrobium pratense]QFG67931.1 DUF3253 domain-containing protein [Ornithinimicrobium pratense]
MRPRDETADRPALEGVLVVVPARDEQDVVGDCLSGLDEAAAVVSAEGLPVVVCVVRHRCTDGTGDLVDGFVEGAEARASTGWVVADSDAETLGEARAEGVLSALVHPVLGSLDPATVWVACTDADSRVPSTWLAVQRELADSGLDLVLGAVEPVDDGSAAVGFWRAHHSVEGHRGLHAASLGTRLSAYHQAGGFPATDVGEDAQLVHAIRHGAGLPWTSTHLAPVVTSSRRCGRRWRGRQQHGLATFLHRLDTALGTFGGSPELQGRLREEVLRLAKGRGAEKTLCPSEAAGAVDPSRRQELTHLARAVACTLADEGLVEVTQQGVVVDGRRAVGPVRVRLVPPPPG